MSTAATPIVAATVPSTAATTLWAYYRITEQCGTITWYSVPLHLTHFNQGVIKVITELLDDLHRDVKLDYIWQPRVPTKEELAHASLQDYTSFKAFLAKHVLGLG